MTSAWRLDDIGDQTGRTAIVTGPSVGGLGHHTALELARRGATVVLAGRTPRRLDETHTAIRDEVPGARLEHLVVDLSDLDSVRAAAAHASTLGPLDLLVDNAGVMATPRTRTGAGLELQLATNHLGPFLLTGLVLPQLAASGAGRVVVVSSQLHRMARHAPLGDPTAPARRYSRWMMYARTKLANLLFAYELDRRCAAGGVPVRATAAHPGLAGTHLAANGRYGRSSGGVATVLDGAVRALSQPAALGAWPTLMAATADLPGGTYCGPSGPGELSGTPQVTTSSALSRDERVAAELWELSERTVGLEYP